MTNITPRNAAEALRLIRCIEAAKRGDFDIYPAGDGLVSLYSWKSDASGKRTRTLYEVNVTTWNCTCPDFAANGRFCKHLLAVEAIADEEDREAEMIREYEARESNPDFLQDCRADREIERMMHPAR